MKCIVSRSPQARGFNPGQVPHWPRGWPRCLGLLLVVLSMAGGRISLAGVTGPALTVTPNTVTNDYVGMIELDIAGVGSGGETVLIEKYYDGNGNGVIDAGERLVGSYLVTDGQVAMIGGMRNLNVPGDEDGAADGQIRVKLPYSAHEIVGRQDGRFIYRVSSAPGGAWFTPSTATLTMTQKDYGGSGITGTVMAAGNPVPYATVLIAVASNSGDKNIVGLTQADASGNYSIKLAAGTYSLRGNKAGYVFDTSSAPSIPVVAGTMVTGQTVTLVASGRTISGSVRDATSHQQLPGVLISGQSSTGIFSFTFTDASGNFVSEASAEPWRFESDEWPVAQLGYLKLKVTESSLTSVTGFHFDLPRATALIYGNLATGDMPPVALPLLEVTAMQLGGAGANTDAVTDAHGNYTLGVTTGSWDVSVSSVPNAVVLDQYPVVNTDGSTVQQDLVATTANTHLKGVAKDDMGNLVKGLPIYANDLSSNNSTTDVNGVTDANDGSFDLTVFGGTGGATRTWGIGILFNSNTTPTFIGSTPSFQVQDGVDITGIVYLVHGITAHVSGQVLDENDAPIGNIAIFADPSGNSGAGANTGMDVAADGTFTNLPFFAGNWTFGLSNINGLGLIPLSSSITVADGDNITGVKVYAHHANATIVGTVKDANNNPIVGVQVFGNLGGSGGGGGYSTSSTTDDHGAFSMPAFSGTWDVGLSGNDLQSQGYQQPANQTVFLNTKTVAITFVTSQTGVVTTAATGITSTGATLNGSFTGNGNDLNTSFQWGSSATALTHTLSGSPGTVSSGTSSSVSASLNFLTPNTTYFYRVLGSDDFGTVYGATMSFKTLAAVTTPTVITLAATGVTAGGVTLNGSVNAKGVTTQVLFQGGGSTAYASNIPANPSTVTGSTTTPVNANITGLQAHTTYHFRLQGASSQGLANGADLTFKTLDQPPVANPDTYSVLPGAKATLDVLHNDTDPDNDVLSILSFTRPASGGTVAKVGNTLVFTASSSFTASTSFTYVASDGFGGISAPATVTLNPGSCSLPTPPSTPPSAGGSYNIAVTAVGAWSVSEVLPWVSVSPLSGVGSGQVTVTLLPNPSPVTRTGTITIGGQSYTVSQAGVQPPTISTPSIIPPAIVGGFYSLAIPSTNGPVIYTAIGPLPAGLALNKDTGVISGTPTAGNVTTHVTVKATNAAGTAGPLPPFDIFVQPLPQGTVGSFQGLIKREPILNNGLGSRLELTTTAAGSVTGKIITGSTTQAITGHIIAVPASLGQPPNRPECRVSVPRAGGTPLTLDVLLDGASNTLAGTLSDGGENTSAANAWRNFWSVATPAAAYQSYYTFSLEQTDTSPSFPQGYGYGSFTVAPTTGALTVTGKLADGNGFSTITFVGPQGQVLLYQSLYSNKGSLAGTLTITAALLPVNNTISGGPSWYKPLPAVASTDTLYPTGFGPVHLTADGGSYVAPTVGLVVMGLSNLTNDAQLTFTGGGLSAEPDIIFSITNPSLTGFTNKVTMPLVNPNTVTMTVLTPGTGAFSGGFTILGPPNRTVSYQGQIVNHSGGPKGNGYFLMPQLPGTGQTLLTSPKLSGTVLLGSH